MASLMSANRRVVSGNAYIGRPGSAGPTTLGLDTTCLLIEGAEGAEIYVSCRAVQCAAGFVEVLRTSLQYIVEGSGMRPRRIPLTTRLHASLRVLRAETTPWLCATPCVARPGDRPVPLVPPEPCSPRWQPAQAARQRSRTSPRPMARRRRGARTSGV